MLWNCTAAKDVWIKSSSRIHKCTSDKDSFMGIFLKLHNRFGEEDMQLIATISRQIWLCRNKWVFYGIFTPPTQVVRSARDQIEAFSSADQSRREQLVLP